MPSVNFTRSFVLQDDCPAFKEQAQKYLKKYLDYPEMFVFNDVEQRVTLKSERLIPTRYTRRPRVMLLFSNPHPHSVHQGMLLSANTRGRENLFWPIMRAAGWINFREETRHPQQIANRCFKVDYQGPFDLVFYPYYAFPTDYPDHIQKVSGKASFKQVIEPKGCHEFRAALQETGVQTVVTFYVGIFNLVLQDQVTGSRDKLIAGELIQSKVSGIEGNIPVFYTFPTGWRFNKNYVHLRTSSLEGIKQAIAD